MRGTTDDGLSAVGVDDVAVGIVADDLTGANDSAVQFVGEGWPTRLALTYPLPGVAGVRSVLGVVTDARPQDGLVARASTASAVTALHQAGYRRLYVKVDSTMRGSVAGQIAGAVDAWSEYYPRAFAVVCTAYPAIGRTLEDGHILVHGSRVEATAVGRDPVTPVSTSDLSELLPGSVGLRLGAGTSNQLAAQIEAVRADGAGIVVVDARTDVDLAAIASAINHLGTHAIPVGAAGLAAAMATVWADSSRVGHAQFAGGRIAASRVLVVGSSLHDVSRRQSMALIDSVFPDEIHVFDPPADVVLDPSNAERWIQDQLGAVSTMPRIAVINSPRERVRHPGLGGHGEAPTSAIARTLAMCASAILDRHDFGALVLIGGDGARAVLQRLGTRTILVRGAIREGVPIGGIEGGQADGLTVVTKAGGFGGDLSLVEIIRELLRSDT